ncbi:MAG TPA: hypothetical protein VJ963_10705, partial [Bacteroidales bacterium]|nr:hypothetical protein [Bacteroidales bacterium]
MIKRIKPAYLLLTWLLFIQGPQVNAQMTMADYLRNKFTIYCKDVPREDVFINTDRDEYISGEEMWFSTYLFDRQSQSPSDRSRIVYVELLNPENRPVVQQRVGIINGFGPGQVIIPDTLTTGTYTLRAYTSWMKNFLPVNCFVKKVRIWNALNTKRFEEKEIIAEAEEPNYRRLTSVSADKSISFGIKKTGGEILQVTVNANNTYRALNNNLIYLFIQTHGKINFVNAELLAGDTTKIMVPLSYISPGISQVTLFNLKGLPVCERYMYTPVRKSEVPVIHASDSTGCRSRVTVDINLKRIVSGNDYKGLSVSVAPVAGRNDRENIDNYMLFGSEFGIIDPAVYTDSNGEIDPVKVDSLLTSIHSNWIDWKRIITFKGNRYRYPFENEFHFLSGTLLGSEKGNGTAGKFVFLSKPSKVATFRYAKTDVNGNFVLGLHIDELLKKLVIQPEMAVQGQTL